MNDAFNLLEFGKTVVYVMLGAAATGIPLYRKLRKIQIEVGDGNLRLRGKEAKLTREDELEHEKIEQQKKINAEAEWKRIIEFRDAELVRLRERDDQQERQLKELWDRHIECQRSEAAQGERIKSQDIRIAASETRIQTMEKQLAELLTAVITKGKG